MTVRARTRAAGRDDAGAAADCSPRRVACLAGGGAGRAATGRFRTGVELVSLNVTVTDGAKYVTGLEAGRLRGLRGRRQAGHHVLLERSSSRSRSRSCSTPATAWRRSWRPRRRRRSASPAHAQGRRDRGDRLQQPGPHPAGVHQRRRRARARDPPDDGQRLDVALQRHLHLAEGTEEGARARRPTRSAARRSSCCPTATTRRAWSSTTRCSTWRSDRRRRSTRSACGSPRSGGREFKEAEFVLRQLSQETGRPGVLPHRRRASCRRSTSRSPTSWPASTASPTRRRTRCATAPGGASTCASTAPGLTARTRQGYYGAYRTVRRSCIWLPFCCTPPPRRPTSRTSRGAIRASAGWRRRCSAAASSPTRSSSACRRCRPGTRRSSARARRSRRSSGCSGSSYLYVELTHRRAVDGRVRRGAAGRARRHSGARPDDRRRGRRCCAARSSRSTSCRCCSPTRASRSRACSASPTCCCSRRSRRSTSGFFYARLPSLQVLDVMNGRAITVGLDLPDARAWRSAASGRRRSTARPIRGRRRCRSPTRRSWSRWSRWAVYSFALFARRAIGWSGRRAA